MAQLELRSLSFTYPGRVHRALDHVSLSVAQGEFVLLCGVSGSGKSTLLRLLKREIAPAGLLEGKMLYDGRPLDALDARVSAAEIGIVLQSPENQSVTDRVWHELAFGLENLGLPSGTIRRRVAEMASFFGIQGWFDRSVSDLSGGQLQTLNLASVLCMQPRVLLLDEPTSQLDPIAAADFLGVVRRVNRELDVTVLLCEHRLEEVFPMADRVAVLEEGRLFCDAVPREAARLLADSGHPIADGLPAAARIFGGLGGRGPAPLTVREGARFLRQTLEAEGPGPCDTAQTAGPEPIPLPNTSQPAYPEKNVPAAELSDIWFRYGRLESDVLRGASLKLFPGRLVCLLGGNGTGKSTALSVAAGLLHPQRGTVRLFGRKIGSCKPDELYKGLVGLLPQNQQLVFSCETVEEDLWAMARDVEPGGEASAHRARERFERVVEEMELGSLLHRHPYDLSGGEQQKAAFAKILLRGPRILLLDEPTKGLDAHFRLAFGQRLRTLAQNGAAILMATHDVDFAARFADRCLLFFSGEVASQDAPAAFFAGNSFYTTAANRIARRVFPSAVTCEDVIRLCKTAAKQP